MQCQYCAASNAHDEHRCGRCGRRLQGDAPRFRVIQSQALPDIDPVITETAAVAEPTGPQVPSHAPTGAQGVLFGPPPGPRPVAAPVRPSRKNSVASLPATHAARQDRRNARAAQQELDLDSASMVSSASQRRKTDAVIYCDAPVAPVAKRLLAGAIDGLLIGAAAAVFLTVFLLWSGGTPFNTSAQICFGVSFAVLALLYKYLWYVANADSPGTCWAGLRVINFDGYCPTRQQRTQRLLASCLGLAAAGLGLLWGLADEESLTWHDHISKTFPTLRSLTESQA